MSWLLVYATPHTSVLTDQRVIKACDVHAVDDATALLAEAGAVLAQARREAAAIRSAAHDEGTEEALAEVRDAMAMALASLAADVSAEGRRRDDELAQAAYAAVETMLGTGGVDAIGRAIVTQALESFVGDEIVTVTVAPGLADRLRKEFGDQPKITVVADPGKGPLDAELKIGSGTIDVGAKTQLAALADRWGVAPRAAA